MVRICFWETVAEVSLMSTTLAKWKNDADAHKIFGKYEHLPQLAASGIKAEIIIISSPHIPSLCLGASLCLDHGQYQNSAPNVFLHLCGRSPCGIVVICFELWTKVPSLLRGGCSIASGCCKYVLELAFNLNFATHYKGKHFNFYQAVHVMPQ